MANRRMPFLVNPGGKKGKKARRRAGAAKRRTKRNPPAGFATWADYMASIRPGAKRARSNSGGSTVARKGSKRRKATTRARRNPSRATSSRRRRSRARRNPPAILRNLPGFAMDAGIGAVSAIGGKLLARKGRALVKQAPGTVFGMAAEAIIGIAAGAAVATKFPRVGRDIALGGIMSPLESIAARVTLPVIGQLGADDYYLGYSDGVDALAGGQLAGYVAGDGAARFGDDELTSRYVAGNIGG